jgi:hypothetical protein
MLASMVVGFTATSAYHHLSCEFESCSLWGVLDTTLCRENLARGLGHLKVPSRPRERPW